MVTGLSVARERLIVRAIQVRADPVRRDLPLGNELLQAATIDGFTRVQIAFRVEGDHVQEREVTGVVSLAAETAEDGRNLPWTHLPIKNPQHLVPGVDVEEVSLVAVSGERNVQSRSHRLPAGSPVGSGYISGSELDRNDLDQGPHLVENLDPVVPAITDVQQPFHTHDHAVRMPAADRGELSGAGARRAPLPQILAGGIEHDDAMVAVAIGDVDVVRHRIDGDIGRVIERHRAAVEAGLTALPADSVAHGPTADLEQQFFSVAGPLLNHAAAAARDPEIAFVVDEAAMDAGR